MGIVDAIGAVGAGQEMRPLLLVLLLLQCVMCSERQLLEQEQGQVEEGRLAPWFVLEPASEVVYGARAGAVVRCVARGRPPPTLVWLDVAAGTSLQDRPDVRRVYDNGTLEVFGGTTPTLTSLTPRVVRCRAENAHGVALSREVRLVPVPDEPWEPTMSVAPEVTPGSVAALLCRVTPRARAGLVRVERWYKDDRLISFDAPSPEARLLMAGDVLLVGETRATDAGRYTCVARDTLTGDTKRVAAHAQATLTLTSRTTSSAPRLVTGLEEVTVPAGTDFCMPCVSTEHPPPHYTWYREWNGRLEPVETSGTVWLWREGAALCVRGASRDLAGAWLCKAYNVYGEATAQVRLTVTEQVLTVSVSPTVVVAPAGDTIRLRCTTSDTGASLTWTHDAAPAGAGPDLVLRDLARHHTGLYQCFARRRTDSAQASAEVRLGDSPPELRYTFIEQALRGGGDVSLRCAASGSPPPRFTWLVDGAPVDPRRAPRRLALAEQPAPGGDVLAMLNVTAAAPTDGGRYTCRAHNRLGHADHSARLNIYGPPSIRALGPVRVVAGANATIYCPYAGYPIRSIEVHLYSVSWWRRGSGRVGVGSGGGRVWSRGPELRLSPALAQDAGHYACEVAAPDGAAATQEIEIQVRNPPKISPFMFSSELTEGSSVQVLCGVSSGDKPMYFSWLKDGEPLPPSLQIEEKSLNEFSLLMFSDLNARHSGEYTCRVSNHAATVNYTATLSVKVAPVWMKEPLDVAVLLGAPLLLECAARGYPPPTITWYRKIGHGDSGSGESEQWERVSEEWGAAGEGGVRAQGGALAARAAARVMSALYRCTADNGVGPPLVKQVNLTVHEPAHFEDMGGNVSCVRGHSVLLSCHALGDAPLVVHWSHAGTRIDLNSYRLTVSEVRTPTGLRSTLQLRAAENTDAGEYRCHAHNQYGRSEILLYLHVEEPPTAPHGIRLGGLSARWVRVTWRAVPGAARPERLTFSAHLTPLHALPATSASLLFNLTLGPVSSDVDGENTLASRIEDLQPAAAYSLRLTAANHVGQSPHSETLTFTTLEEAPAAAPQNVRVRSGNPGELHLSWSAPSQDSWNGEVLGYVVTWREMGHGTDATMEGGRATAPGSSSAELVVSGLRGAARYALILRAFNRAGTGPPAPTLYVTTAEGVPETPPALVSCEPLSPSTMRVRWSPSNRTPSIRAFDVHYAPLHIKPDRKSEARTVRAAVGGAGEVTLQALLPRTNYSVWVRARGDAGPGPSARPLYCLTHDDVPGVVERVAVLAAGVDAVRVTWLAPTDRRARLSHYTLYTRELGKSGGEWSQRVDAGEEEEVWREVRGLRPAVYEMWVQAHAATGAGPASRILTAAPALPVSARISSFGRVIYAPRDSRVRLRCSAVGTPPIRWQWSPLPQAHTLTDSGDLILHKVESESSGNFTCSVRNAGGSDASVVTLVVVSPPNAPAPRLVRAEPDALHLAWDASPTAAAPLLGYTVVWSREGGAARAQVWLPAADMSLVVRRLACGATYRLIVHADNAVGVSSPSRPLLARTKGDKAKPAPGKEFVWANSSTLRLNLLTWRARCSVVAWRVALRRADSADRADPAWLHLTTDGETAEANDLIPGTWYEVNVVASSPAGETVALYRAGTLTLAGERVGEAVEVPSEYRTGAADVTESRTGAGGGAVVAAVSLVAALVVALAVALVVLRRRAAPCLRREYLPRQVGKPHPQLYTTEPGKRNGKALTPPDDEVHEISPYATFSMLERAGGRGEGCALHLHTFARAECLNLAAPPPPRPNLLAHDAHLAAHTAAAGASAEYGRCRDSDSESSGSPCAACVADLYRLTPTHTLLAGGPESSAEDTSCPRPRPAPRRRRDRHPPTGRAGAGRSAVGAS